MPAREVAECVWAAYHDETGRLHWYVPEDIGEIEKLKGSDVNAVRQTMRASVSSEAS